MSRQSRHLHRCWSPSSTSKVGIGTQNLLTAEENQAVPCRGSRSSHAWFAQSTHTAMRSLPGWWFWRTDRIVSWLTPKSAARERRLLVAERARMVASLVGVSLRGRLRYRPFAAPQRRRPDGVPVQPARSKPKMGTGRRRGENRSKALRRPPSIPRSQLDTQRSWNQRSRFEAATVQSRWVTSPRYGATLIPGGSSAPWASLGSCPIDYPRAAASAKPGCR